jgi:hypothetical protein
MRFASKYKLFRKDLDKPRRRAVTVWCLVASLGITAHALLSHATSRTDIVVVYVSLIVLLVAYRILKDTVGGRPAVASEETLEDDVDLVLDRIERIKRGLQEQGQFPS